ncbi:hypothetical protein [Couchioplanes caeruleus]|uniref:DUF2945 family protein n=1 Tax=Couchioplanes caeruleus TaxID=56438 RepID=A0A3N1GFS8_9ACTN|nr:hypothetical protein [Couchioplanes caeruleus]ROP29133.1 DUF2945 family protein [Couchioplanes caeruleus]
MPATSRWPWECRRLRSSIGLSATAAPQYVVKSGKTGRTAVHKPEALKHGK